MEKHILSKFAEKSREEWKKSPIDNEGKTTYETSTIEVTDPDEFIYNGSTLETRSQESSDPDEFVMEATLLTENVENSDPDEFMNAGPTKGTFSLEDSDPDELVVGCLDMCIDKDFDEVLLI